MPAATLSDPDQWISHVRTHLHMDPQLTYHQLLQCKHLPERQMKLLCARVRDLLLEESNVQPVQSPVTVCGDIHGQFWDVLEILRQGGMVPGTSYIFMVSLTCIELWFLMWTGRFRRSRVLQLGDIVAVAGLQGSVRHSTGETNPQIP